MHMQATNNSGQQTTKPPRCHRPATSNRAETAVYLTLGIAGFAAVLLAVISSMSPLDDQSRAGRLPVVHYFRSGQWLADVRTARAMVIYVFDSDGTRRDTNLPTAATNAVDTERTQQNVAMPTNHASARPKA